MKMEREGEIYWILISLYTSTDLLWGGEYRLSASHTEIITLYLFLATSGLAGAGQPQPKLEITTGQPSLAIAILH